MHPDAYCLAYKVRFGYCADEPAVAAVIAIVAHYEVMPFRHPVDAVAHQIRRIRNQDFMSSVTELLNKSRIHGSGIGVFFQIHLHAVDHESVTFVTDFIAGQTDHAFDVIDARVRWQTKHNHITTLGAARPETT